MTLNSTRLAYVLLILTTLFWGGNSVAGKMAVGEISPMLLTLSRWMLAAAFIVPFAIPDLKREWPIIRKHWLLFAFYGAVGFTLFNVLLYTALTKTSAVSASIVQASMPATVYFFNFLLFRVKVTVWQIAGFAVTLSGVMIVATHGELARLATLDLNAGDALVLAAVVVYAIYTVFLRYKPQLNWKCIIIVLSTAAALAALPFVWWEWQSGALILPGRTGLLIALYTGIFPSIISQIFYIRGVELIGPNRAGIFVNLVPIFGTALAIIILGEPLEAFHITALALVIAGIWLAERKAG
ncbi:MAG: DMT family transporter [Rhizobiaceae bacterium]